VSPRLAIVALLLQLAAPVYGSDRDAAPADDLLHADLPLFDDETADKWPQSMGGDAIGCSTRVAFGNWIYRPSSKDEDPLWYGFSNYGAFHCWALVGSANDEAGLATTDRRPSFFVLLSKDPKIELWALQMGASPGSDYLLLSRKPGSGIIRRFDVLQRDCPPSMLRRGRSIDILLTDYCAIDSRTSLIALAKAMSERPPLGHLTLSRDPSEEPAG
jgi:hypothetical protein